MKLFQCAVALGSLCLQAASQRLGESCSATSCAEGGDCVPFSQLSPEGRTCRVDAGEASRGVANKLLATQDTAADCADAAAADPACSAVFLFTPSSSKCECHVSSDPRTSCDLAVAFETTVYSVETTTPYCSCVDATEGFGGQQCDVEKTVSFDFVKQLNTLNDIVNSGDLFLRAAEIAGFQGQSEMFNYISLLSAASLLDRGFDAEVTLNIELSSDVEQTDWEHVVTEAMVDALKSAGFSVTAGNFQVLDVQEAEGSTGAANVNATTMMPVSTCHCAEVKTAFSSGCDLSCTQLEVVYFVSEVARLVEWELSLIIVACVIAVCLLAIGLSFCKSDAAKAASADVAKVRCILLEHFRSCCSTWQGGRGGVGGWRGAPSGDAVEQLR